jgi:ribose transport system substrate-binding protein
MLVVASGLVATASSVSASAAPSISKALAALPKADQGAYVQVGQPDGFSAYGNFKSKYKAPYTIGYSSEYAGNSWRLGAINYLNKTLVPQYEKAGLVKRVITLQSNLSDATQIQQIRQLVNDGVAAIFTCCASTSALNSAIAYSNAHGVPFFVYSGYSTSKYSINTSANYVLGGESLAAQLAKSMNFKGNVLDVEGIPGATSNDSIEAGMRLQMKKYPNIKIVGTVDGTWTDTIVKTQVLRYLATHPGPINGIFVQSPGEAGALGAMQASGRPMVPITVSGEVATACYWSKNPNWATGATFVWPPVPEIAISFNVMIRTLEGQDPIDQSIIWNPVKSTLAQLKSELPANCSTSSTDWIGPTPTQYMPTNKLNGFFKHGKNLL